MEHDELTTLWQEAGRRLAAMEPALRLNARLASAGVRDRTRSKLGFVRLVLWYEVGFAAVAAVFIGAYLANNFSTLRFAIPAALLQGAAILSLGLAARQLVRLHEIDYAGPVLAIQLGLAEVHVLRARSNRWLLLSSPLLWALLVVVVPHGLVGLDVYRAFGFAWVAGNVAVGLAVIGAAAWAGPRLSRSSRGSAFVRWLGDDVTGRNIAHASQFLDDLAAFESEA